jgi:ankyrin repeat protein
LVALGADMEAKTAAGETPLHSAASHGHVEAVKALVALGADMEAKGAVGATPLHTAAANGHVEAVMALVALGADMEAKTANGETPLLICRRRGHRQAELVLRSQPGHSRRKGKAPVTQECTEEAIAHAQRMGDALIEEEERAKAKAAKGKVSGIPSDAAG